MKKLIISVLTVIILLGCQTTHYVDETNIIDEIITDEKIEESPIQRDILLELDSSTREIATYLLDIINNRDWNTLAMLTNEDLYNSYIQVRVDYQQITL